VGERQNSKLKSKKGIELKNVERKERGGGFVLKDLKWVYRRGRRDLRKREELKFKSKN
jgi:hypothetical protein